MTREGFRKSKEYVDMKNKIKNYSIGFKFTLPYYKMTRGQKNAMDVVTYDCIKEGILESISIGLDIEGNQTEETFRRI